jgi:uncharacterized protein YjcR
MDKCIIDLMSAVTQVRADYFSSTGTRYDQTQYEQVTENSFTAELYHRFKNLMELNVNKDYYDNLIFQFDITKMAYGIRPDLVLHQNQANRNVQKMFIEVKTDTNADLTDDFNKLISATDNYLNFENAVMITVNRKYGELLNLIRQHHEFFNLEDNRKDRMYFINVNTANDKPQYDIFSLKYNRELNRNRQ